MVSQFFLHVIRVDPFARFLFWTIVVQIILYTGIGIIAIWPEIQLDIFEFFLGESYRPSVEPPPSLLNPSKRPIMNDDARTQRRFFTSVGGPVSAWVKILALVGSTAYIYLNVEPTALTTAALLGLAAIAAFILLPTIVNWFWILINDRLKIDPG